MLRDEVRYMLLIKKTQDLKLDKVSMKENENDYKDTYKGFTKLVIWGTTAVVAILAILALTLL